jgi:spore germination protein YaaH
MQQTVAMDTVTAGTRARSCHSTPNLETIMIAKKFLPAPMRILVASLTLAAGALCGNAAAAPFVLAYTDGQIAQSYSNLQAYYASLSAVGLGSSYAMLANGSVDTSGVTPITNNIIAFAKTKNLPIYPTVSDYSNAYGGFDPAVSNGFLATASGRSTAVSSLVSLAVNNGFAGIDIDLEAVQPGMKAQMSSFISALATALHNQNKKLVISIPPMSGDGQPAYLAGYDYAAIGAAVDYFQLMTYDEVGPGWSSSPSATWPGPEAGLDWMKAKLNYAVSRVPAAKVLHGLPTYGYDYSTKNMVYWKGTNGVAGYNDVIASHSASKKRDSASATPYATWGTVLQQPDGTEWSTANKQPVLWYDDAQSITAKAALVGSYALGGTSVWAMGYEDAGFWSAVSAGLGGGGGTASGNIAGGGTGYVWTANASANANTNKVVAAAVNDGNTDATLILNGNGEGGTQKWQAAGVTFGTARTISSARFINGALDTYGNGYFEGGVSLQYTTNGSTWLDSGWALNPAYPNSAAASGVTYTFSGNAIAGVTGVRVAGRTGASSWSGSVKELQVFGN